MNALSAGQKGAELTTAQRQARKTLANLSNARIDDIIQHGLHEFIEDFITENNRLGGTIFDQYLQ